MKKNHYFYIFANFFAVILLITLIATPIYFAKNFAKVAGVKSDSQYLLISQIEKFPNLILNQSGNSYQINFTKISPNQAFLDVFVLNNPTDTQKVYQLESKSSHNFVFFGNDPQNLKTKTTLLPNSSISISLVSQKEASNSSQSAEFSIR